MEAAEEGQGEGRRSRQRGGSGVRGVNRAPSIEADRMAEDATPQGPQAVRPRRHRRTRASAPDRHLDAGRRIAFAVWLALGLALRSGAPRRPDQWPERLSAELHHLPWFEPRGKHWAV